MTESKETHGGWFFEAIPTRYLPIEPAEQVCQTNDPTPPTPPPHLPQLPSPLSSLTPPISFPVVWWAVSHLPTKTVASGLSPASCSERRQSNLQPWLWCLEAARPRRGQSPGRKNQNTNRRKHKRKNEHN